MKKDKPGPGELVRAAKPAPDEVEFRKEQMNKNKKDPLRTDENAENVRKVLWEKFSDQAVGFPHRDVIFAAGNMILNAIRQTCKTSISAEREFDEVFGHLKNSLLTFHYQSNGKRRDTFPHHQIIAPSHIEFKNIIHPAGGGRKQ